MGLDICPSCLIGTLKEFGSHKREVFVRCQLCKVEIPLNLDYINMFDIKFEKEEGEKLYE